MIFNTPFIQRFLKLLKKREGQGLVEYGLVIALVAIAVITALTLLGTNLSGLINDLAGTIGGTVGTP